MMEDFRRTARQIVLVLERRGVPQQVQQEIVDTVEGRLPAGPEPAVEATADEAPTDDWDVVEPADEAASPGSAPQLTSR